MQGAMKGRSGSHAEGNVTDGPFGRYANLARWSKGGASSFNRLEIVWAWASLLVLIICWDAALRLDQRVSVPRVRIAHAAESTQPAPTGKWAEL